MLVQCEGFNKGDVSLAKDTRPSHPKSPGSSYKLTPVYSTHVLLSFKGDSANTGAANAQMRAAFGTGIAPSNGASFTGTAIGLNLINASPAACCVAAFDTGGIMQL
jgi:hypothetical protein